MHIDTKGHSPAQKFCKITQQLDFKNINTWGCPCCVLDFSL